MGGTGRYCLFSAVGRLVDLRLRQDLKLGDPIVKRRGHEVAAVATLGGALLYRSVDRLAPNSQAGLSLVHELHRILQA